MKDLPEAQNQAAILVLLVVEGHLGMVGKTIPFST